MKVKLLKKIRNRFTWEYIGGEFFVLDNVLKQFDHYSQSRVASFKMADKIISTHEYERFYKKRDIRLYNKANRFLEQYLKSNK